LNQINRRGIKVFLFKLFLQQRISVSVMRGRRKEATYCEKRNQIT